MKLCSSPHPHPKHKHEELKSRVKILSGCCFRGFSFGIEELRVVGLTDFTKCGVDVILLKFPCIP